jgi:perosamine synthetase
VQTGGEIYPRPHIPLSPVLSRYALSRKKAVNSISSIMDSKYVVQLTSGRAAIALALEHSGVGHLDEVLLPAFHCESMVAPARWLNAKPVFYRIKKDTSIDLDDMRSKLTSRTRAVLITHYFGFLQELDAVATFCRENGLTLVEDCAHTFFVIGFGGTAGMHGDYAIASSMKFFPVYDGGILSSNTHDITKLKLDSTPIAFELKSFFRLLELAIEYRRFGFLGKMVGFAITIKDIIWRWVKGSAALERVAKRNPASSDGGYGLDEDWIRVGESLCSRIIMRYSNVERIVVRRRENYVRLENALRHLDNIHSLYPELPSHVVPLVYPVYVDNPAEVFEPLKLLGVPIWRFGEYLDEEVVSGLCESSVELSQKVFQFPCHQELTDAELTWMIETIINVMSPTQKDLE